MVLKKNSKVSAAAGYREAEFPHSVRHGQLRSGLNQMVRKRDMGRGKETGRRRSDSDRDMG